MAGTATAASYDTATGAGTASRVNSSNRSWIAWPTIAGQVYLIDVQNTGAVSLLIRDTTSNFVTLTAGNRAARFVAMTTTSLRIEAATDGTTASFTIHSFRSPF